MASKPRRRRVVAARAPVTRAAFRELEQQVNQILTVVESNAAALASVQRENAASVRRCAELQLEIDRLKKTPLIA
jgi:hypothetical protein